MCLKSQNSGQPRQKKCSFNLCTCCMNAIAGCFGFLSAFVYVLPWLTLTLFYPFMFGWKNYFLSGALNLLQNTYNISETSQAVTLLQLACGISIAVFTFLFLSANRLFLNQRAPCLKWVLLLVFSISSPIFLWLAKDDFDSSTSFLVSLKKRGHNNSTKRNFTSAFIATTDIITTAADDSVILPEEKHNFWLFSIFVCLSGLGDAAYIAFVDGTIQFFFKRDHRYLRMFLSAIAEGFGEAFGLYCGRREEDVPESRQEQYSEKVFLILAGLFFAVTSLLSITLIHNLFARLACKFCGYPSFFVNYCLKDRHAKKEDDVQDYEDDDNPSRECCIPLKNCDEDEDDVLLEPQSASAKRWLFHSLTLCQMFSLFTKNGFLFWGLHHMEEVLHAKWVKKFYAIQIGVGTSLGALAATLFVKIYIDRKLMIDFLVSLVVGFAVTTSTLCLFLSLVLHTFFAAAYKRLIVFWVTNMGYAASMSLAHLIIDEVQFRLISPKVRELGFSGEMAMEQIGQAASPFFIEFLVVTMKMSLNSAMTLLLPSSLLIGLAIFTPLAIYALTGCKRRKRNIRRNNETIEVEKQELTTNL